MFAPDNAAFAKIPAATLNGVLADKAELTKILTYHVVAGRYTPAQLVSGTSPHRIFTSVLISFMSRLISGGTR